MKRAFEQSMDRNENWGQKIMFEVWIVRVTLKLLVESDMEHRLHPSWVLGFWDPTLSGWCWHCGRTVAFANGEGLFVGFHPKQKIRAETVLSVYQQLSSNCRPLSPANWFWGQFKTKYRQPNKWAQLLSSQTVWGHFPKSQVKIAKILLEIRQMATRFSRC